jgi:hypothetical protein
MPPDSLARVQLLDPALRGRAVGLGEESAGRVRRLCVTRVSTMQRVDNDSGIGEGRERSEIGTRVGGVVWFWTGWRLALGLADIVPLSEKQSRLLPCSPTLSLPRGQSHAMHRATVPC